jgi:ketosteroid isomerase-like protein
MERSEEIEGVIRGLFDSMAAGDAVAFQDLLSREPGVLFLGTDAAEWWDGHDTIARVAGEQFKEMQGIEVGVSDAAGFSDGDVGWGSARARYAIPGGGGNEIRFTGVFRREDGRWRLVQGHSSIGVANEEAFGMAMPT